MIRATIRALLGELRQFWVWYAAAFVFGGACGVLVVEWARYQRQWGLLWQFLHAG
jgi:hypothetical protein